MLLQIDNIFPNIKYMEPMNEHTSFKVGGKADIFIEPDSIEELVSFIKYLKDNKTPFILLGNGTNVLISDDGIKDEDGNLCGETEGFKFKFSKKDVPHSVL